LCDQFKFINLFIKYLFKIIIFMINIFQNYYINCFNLWYINFNNFITKNYFISNFNFIRINYEIMLKFHY